MAERTLNLSGIYRFTSIARPIDPAYFTNRALLIVLPLLALLSAGLAAAHDMGNGPLGAALSGALVSFAAWALTRELAPDHNGAAFVALAIAWAANVVLATSSVLLVFVALVLVRIVNRSTGLSARIFDTLSVLGFCIWATVKLSQPLILLPAFAAFTLDAILKNPLRRHHLAAAVCLPVFVWMLVDGVALISSDLLAQDWLLIAVFAGGIIAVVNKSPKPVSYCDTSPDRLDNGRVNAGLIVGFVVAMQALLTEGRSEWLETPIWACFAAVLFSHLAARAKKRPTP